MVNCEWNRRNYYSSIQSDQHFQWYSRFNIYLTLDNQQQSMYSLNG